MTAELPPKSDQSKDLLTNLSLLSKMIGDGMDGPSGSSRLEKEPEKMATDILEFAEFIWKDVHRKLDPAYMPRKIEAIREKAATMPDVEATAPSFNEFVAPLKGGFKPGWIVIVGAFTGGGKTTWQVRETVHKAYLGNPTLYISCELVAEEIQAKVDLAATEDGFAMPDLPIWIEDRFSGLGEIIKLIETWTASLPEGGKTPVVALDYLQRVRAGAQSNREREVAIVAEELQQLARRLGIILIAAAQLNRNSQSEGESGPQLHHLRESGLIEQIADAAFLINKTSEDRMAIKLAKNRWGPADIQVEYAVDFGRCRIEPISETTILEEVSDRVIEYLEGCKGGKAKPREISQTIKVNGRHPSTSEILKAGRMTRKYAMIDGLIGAITPKI